ncbi:MAG: high-affinity nickel-transporter [Oscillatoriales cyanobacterium]|uniref:Nickel/cobalt efflux system n=1 Tax=Microcoleus anatoxicus PTRS2 TaxID=2705321 RepID=A0ABU8YPG5_9CYAN|nr:MAG: high-affinity nickel-transporter [Oscillatoriales cyanobacterium]TAF36291.1 MAG: high-affinity nickel-transporter [Oscillatoriales cyanobacterium]TAF62025.1 MAG: high-affinity nickel-transporter [Oscillatoriales cyanobacterium]
MQNKSKRSPKLFILFFLTLSILLTTSTNPAYSHWADLSVAEIVINDYQTEITLTFPTGLTKFADDNQDNQLQPGEIRNHKAQLEKFFSQNITIKNPSKIPGKLAVKPLEIAAKTATLIQQPNSHSTLFLDYTWSTTSQTPKPKSPSLNLINKNNFLINYHLFLPGINTASCQATIVQAGTLKSFVFTPQNREFLLTQNESIWDETWSWLLALAGAFAWGAMHAMSPGHGKTIVGAYLVGARATPLHAVFLAATTTITHTAGVFAVGGITLFASHLINPEKLTPWLNLISGFLVALIGFKLLIERTKNRFGLKNSVFKYFKTKIVNQNWDLRTKVLTMNYDEPVNLLNRGSWEREFQPVKPKISEHYHHHGDGRVHSHLPPGADGSPVTWKSLLALGISGGLLPCPSALVMLLSASALGSVGLGMTLVVAFSLGLALVLTAIGLILVYAKGKFDKLPKQLAVVKILPGISAMLVLLLGLGITGQAMLQILTTN